MQLAVPPPVDASTVESGGHANLNFGASTNIYAGTSYSRTAYVRFDIAALDLSHVTSVALRLTPNGAQPSQEVSFYALNDGLGDSWVEGLATGQDSSLAHPEWIRGANAPGYSGTSGNLDPAATTFLGSFTGPLIHLESLTFSSAALLNALQADRNGQVTFLVQAANASVFYSDDERSLAWQPTLLLTAPVTPPPPDPDDVAPRGTRFPMMLYSIHTAADMQSVRGSGWNIAQRFGITPTPLDFLQTCSDGGMRTDTRLPDLGVPLTESEFADVVAQRSATGNVAWWELPEGMRYWIADEMNLVIREAQWTRRYDPAQHPNYIYLPGHYSTTAVRQYVPYVDVISAGCYVNYQAQPHAWVRWRMESVIAAIRAAGASIGDDYLNDQKTPVAVLELFDPKNGQLQTQAGAYHDFYAALVSGARGISIYSYFHRNDNASLQQVWPVYDTAAAQLTGSEHLDRVIRDGAPRASVTSSVISGPTRTPTFTSGDGTVVDYESLNLMAREWNDNLYIIAVNSAEQPVTVVVSGMPAYVSSVDVLFEGTALPVSAGAFTTVFAPLGVHIFKTPLSRPVAITCPPAVTSGTDNGRCDAAGVDLGTPTVVCDTGPCVVTHDGPALWPVGTTTVMWTVTDRAGATSTCQQTVTVVDRAPPSISCPASVSTVTDPGQNFASGVSLGTPSVVDNCGSAVASNDAPVRFPLGTTVVTWTAVDVAGNRAQCQQLVVVRDSEPPQSPTMLKASALTRTSITLSWVAARDNVGVTQYLIYRGGVQIGTSTVTTYTNSGLTPNTKYTYTVRAQDAAGNVSAPSNVVNPRTKR